ncbi:hypothetical protein BZA77DRAFT_97506 [Pyronema omphalodes]|nr:hypothetical protein BZA77DRAFT_97506 [Pyronema omphalodes]
MDPLSVSASVAGFMGLAIQVTKILNAYVNDVKDAPQEASELNTKVSMLIHVLEKVVDTLQSDDMETITIDKHSVLYYVISSCEHHVKLVYKNLVRLRGTNKVKASKGRVSWPLKKEDCLRRIETLHRYTQTFEYLLVVSNRAIMLQGFSQVISKLQQQHRQTIGSINTMKENFIPCRDKKNIRRSSHVVC